MKTTKDNENELRAKIEKLARPVYIKVFGGGVATKDYDPNIPIEDGCEQVGKYLVGLPLFSKSMIKDVPEFTIMTTTAVGRVADKIMKANPELRAEVAVFLNDKLPTLHGVDYEWVSQLLTKYEKLK